jgi:hypothetical protein
VLVTPLELLEALAKFVPPPRVHRHRYHGVLAPNARLRPHVVALGRPEAPTAGGDSTAPAIAAEPAPERASPARIRWAVLLARIYDVLPLLCPACGADMRILAFLTDPPVVSAILLHLDLPHKPPPLSPARGPPQSDLLTGLLDQTPAFDPAEPDPVPDFDFDQSPTISTPEAPESRRPGSLLPAPSPPIQASRRRIRESRDPFCRTRLSHRPRAFARRPRRPSPLPPHIRDCHENPFGFPIRRPARVRRASRRRDAASS